MIRRDDLVLEGGGQKVVVDAVSLPFLADAVIDFTEELIGARFTIQNPNASSSCGCGTSFVDATPTRGLVPSGRAGRSASSLHGCGQSGKRLVTPQHPAGGRHPAAPCKPAGDAGERRLRISAPATGFGVAQVVPEQEARSPSPRFNDLRYRTSGEALGGACAGSCRH